MRTTRWRLRRTAGWTAVAAAMLAAGTTVTPTMAAADPSFCTQVGAFCGFYSPSHHIDCEIDTGGRTGPDSLFCKTAEPAQSATIDGQGTLVTCTGVSCLGNAAENTPTLAYGQAVTLGPFHCLSQKTGMTCTAAPGRGFVISTGGITPVG